MRPHERHLFTALALSTIVMLVNVFAISNGMADDFYYQITNWLTGL